MNYKVKELISEKKIKEKLIELGEKITNDFKSEEEIVLIGLLRGSAIFLADLARQIPLNVKIDFMTVSSYGNSMESSHDIRIIKDIEDDIYNKSVLIVEDIIDTGYTLEKVYEILSLRNPKILKICTLLDKPSRREVEINVDYVGFTIEDVFVVGYGIDYAQKHRNLPYIAQVIKRD